MAIKKTSALYAVLIPLWTLVFCNSVHAQKSESSTDAHVLKIATLAPRGSLWMKVFDAWAHTVKKKTSGRLTLKFYPGGVAGDERDAIRKMRSGQLDGAAVTSVGLGQIVRSVLVLQTPGLFRTYAEIDAVRGEMASEFAQEFKKAGYHLMGWGDVGRGRLFSAKPVRQPSDLKKLRPWVWRDDPVLPELLSVCGANGVQLGLPEVYPALQTKRIDAVAASALATVSLQWFTQLDYMTEQADTVLIGATIINDETYQKLPPDLQKVLMETSKTAHQTLTKATRKDDDRAFKSLQKRGVKSIDTSKYEKQWIEVARKTRERLSGRLFPANLLKRVEDIAAKTRQKNK